MLLKRNKCVRSFVCCPVCRILHGGGGGGGRVAHMKKGIFYEEKPRTKKNMASVFVEVEE